VAVGAEKLQIVDSEVTSDAVLVFELEHKRLPAPFWPAAAASADLGKETLLDEASLHVAGLSWRVEDEQTRQWAGGLMSVLR
jgi:hypothetical protein